MVSNPIEVDGKRRRIVFRGNCLDLLRICEATCCRNDWKVNLSPAEHDSDLYASQPTCALTEKTCDKDAAACLYRGYQLKKDPAGACIHLDANSRCGIYENRPKVCRDFSCQGGWRLSSVFPPEDHVPEPGAKLDKESFVKNLTDDMTFVLHPLIKLHSVFVVRAKGEVAFLKEMVGGCGKFNTRDSFLYPKLNDDLLLRLIRLFESKDSLQRVYQRFCEGKAVGLAKSEFYEIVWLLNKHNIVLDSKNFRGMLAGMGGI